MKDVISSHRPPTKLPDEILLKVFKFGDFTPSELSLMANNLSKAENAVSRVARSQEVWRKWHPESVMRAALAQPEKTNLAALFTQRVRGYPNSVRQAIFTCHKTCYPALPPEMCAALDRELVSGSKLSSCFQLHDQMVETKKQGWQLTHGVWPPDVLAIGTEATLKNFDGSLALVRWKQEAAFDMLEALPHPFWDEEAFVEFALNSSQQNYWKLSKRLQTKFCSLSPQKNDLPGQAPQFH